MFKSLKIKLISIILFLVLSITAILSIFSLNMLYNNSIDSAKSQAIEAGIANCNIISNKIDSYMQILRSLALQDMYSSFHFDVDELNAEYKKIAETTDFSDFVIVDKNGSTYDGFNLSEREYVKRALAGETYINEPVFSKLAEIWQFFISTPAINEKYNFSGVFAGTVELNTFSEMISDVKIGANGITSIINNKGLYVAHTDKSFVENQINLLDFLKEETDGAEYAAAINKAITSKESGISEIFTYNGRNQFIYYSTIEGTDNWTLILDVYIDDFMNGYNKSFTITIVLLIIFIIAGIIFALFFASPIAGSIGKVASRLEKLSKGDLKSEIPKLKSKNEIGKLSNSLNKTIGNLGNYIDNIKDTVIAIEKNDLTHKIDGEYLGDFIPLKSSINNIIKTLNSILSKINESSIKIDSGSNQIAEYSQDLALSSNNQAECAETLLSMISQMTTQINDTAESAKDANRASSETKKAIDQSAEHMKKLSVSMSEINNSSLQISKIIKIIDEISFQTNILALNAAVEAARAGQHGKGFAVVASEVRNLATKSAEAAKQSSQLIETSIRLVDEGVELSGMMSNSLDDVLKHSNVVVDSISYISKASEEQAVSASQVSHAIEDISSTIKNNLTNTEETAAIADELLNQSRTLRDLLSCFKFSN